MERQKVRKEISLVGHHYRNQLTILCSNRGGRTVPQVVPCGGAHKGTPPPHTQPLRPHSLSLLSRYYHL